jgi:hypothetical protein
MRGIELGERTRVTKINCLLFSYACFDSKDKICDLGGLSCMLWVFATERYQLWIIPLLLAEQIALQLSGFEYTM